METLPADFSFEVALERLREIVAAMQQGGPLQMQMDLFREGRALAAQCHAYLEQAELEVRQLTTEGEAPLNLQGWEED